MTASASFSSSETQISAALFLSLARCRSTQLYDAFSLPPTNHFQNGGFDVSSVVCQRSSQVSRSAYSAKQSGNLSSAKRSKIAGSFALAWATNERGGWMFSSSRQCTAIWASETSVSWSVASVAAGSVDSGLSVITRPTAGGGMAVERRGAVVQVPFVSGYSPLVRRSGAQARRLNRIAGEQDSTDPRRPIRSSTAPLRRRSGRAFG